MAAKRAKQPNRGESDAKTAAEERSAEIYRAAAELILQRGFDATSMSDLAKAVGLTKAGLYYYIRGKKDLLYRIMNFAMTTLERQVVQPVGAIADPETRLREIIVRHGRLLTEHGGAITVLTEEVPGLSPAHRKKIIARKRAYLEFVRETLREIKSQGRLRDLDLNVASLNLFGVVLGITRWYQPQGRLSADRVVEETSRFILGALLKNPSN